MLASTYRLSLSVWFLIIIDLLFDACWQHLQREKEREQDWDERLKLNLFIKT